MLELYSEGASDTEVCKELKLPWKEFEKRYNNDSLFQELVDFGRMSAKAWWLRIGRKSASQGAPSQAYGFWYANMKNMYGWSDKSEVTTDDRKVAGKSTDELKQDMAKLMDKVKGKPANAELNEIMRRADGSQPTIQ